MPQQESSVGREVRSIVESLQSIRVSLGRLVPLLGVEGRQLRPAPAPAPARKLKLSPARRAALKLQGQYMGYMRGLKPRQKARVKALAAAKGVGAAVALARQLARA
jgi:hypothetical protein